jgi:hypothetical protein
MTPIGNAQKDAEKRCGRGQFQGGRENAQDIACDRVGRKNGPSEIALEYFGDVNKKLLIEGQVQPQFDADPLIDLGRGAIAHRRQHGVDGHHPADQKGNEEQSQKRQGNRCDQGR